MDGNLEVNTLQSLHSHNTKSQSSKIGGKRRGKWSRAAGCAPSLKLLRDDTEKGPGQGNTGSRMLSSYRVLPTISSTTTTTSHQDNCKKQRGKGRRKSLCMRFVKILYQGGSDKPLFLMSIQQPNGKPLLAVHKPYHPTEAASLKKVQGHRHVVRLIQASHEGVLLEYVETGKNGNCWIPSSIAELVDALFQLTMAVVHCHQNHIIHADIKPSNLLIEKRSNRVVLIDFDCAIMFETNPMGVGPIESGARGWGSPEFEAGDSEECGITVDSWRIGGQ